MEGSKKGPSGPFFVHVGENGIWRRCRFDRNPQRTMSTPPVAVKPAPSQLPFSHLWVGGLANGVKKISS